MPSNRGAAPTQRDIAERKRRQAVWLRENLHYSYDRIAADGLPCVQHAPYAVEPSCVECDPRPMYPSGRSAARKAIMSALEQTYPLDAEHRDALRRDALATIDLGVARLKHDIIDPDADAADRARAVNALVRLLDRQARMTGLDAPSRVQLDEGLDEELRQEIAALEAAVAEQAIGPTEHS
jgi:hypothetical protein